MSKLNLIILVAIVAAFAFSVVVAGSVFAQSNSTNSTTTAAIGNVSGASAAGGNTTSMNIPSTSPGSTSGY